MGRHFDGNGGGGGADAWVRFTAQGLTAFPYGTTAAVVYFAGVDSAHPPSMIIIGGDPGDYWETYVNGTGLDIRAWNGSASSGTGPIAVSTGKWLLLAVTKATGTVNPRSHLFDFATRTWTHTNFAGTLADSSGTGATEHTIGGFATLDDDVWGDLAAAGVLARRAMSDSEVERLAGGNWDRVGFDLHCEWPNGRDNPVGVTRDLSRNRQSENAHAGQSRAARTDPPGFRFSICNRRR